MTDDVKPNPTPRGGILLLTGPVPSDTSLAWVVQAATRIPLRTLTWTAETVAASFDAEVQAALPLVDLVIVDVGALRERGIGLCSRVVAFRQDRRPPSPKLVGLGPTEDAPFEDAAFRAGCDGFVGTPVDRVQLLEQLRKLEAWRLRGAHRAPVSVPLHWMHPDGRRLRGQTRDLSESGLQFDSEQPIPAGQNVSVELKLHADRPAVPAWIRVVRTNPHPDPRGELTATVAAEFLNLSSKGRAGIAEAIAAFRNQEFLARLQQDAAEEATILTHPTVASIADWLHFLVTPVAFGNPPPTLEIDAKELRAAVIRLAPHEELLFGRVETEGLTPAEHWQRVWVGFRVWLHHLGDRAPGTPASRALSHEEFVARARELLELLDVSLTSWNLTDVETSDKAKENERRSVLLTLREGMNLRELYDENRGEDDPPLLAGLAEAEDYFADRAMGDLPAAFKRGAFRRAERARRGAKVEAIAAAVAGPRPRRRVVVVGLLLTAIASAYFAKTALRDENVLVEMHVLRGTFPIFTEASLSRGEDPTVLIADLSPVAWNAMSPSERQKLARELLAFMNANNIKGAILSCEKRLALQIDGGKVVFVQ